MWFWIRQNSLRRSELPLGIILAALVGAAAGLGAALFRWLIGDFHRLFFDGGQSLLSFMGEYYVIVVPAAGGLLVGPLVYFLAREAKGHGVPEVMVAVATWWLLQQEEDAFVLESPW